MSSSKNHRQFVNLNFLFKLLNYKINCSPLLEKINFKNNRNNKLFLKMNFYQELIQFEINI